MNVWLQTNNGKMKKETDNRTAEQEKLIQQVRNRDLAEERKALRSYNKIRSKKDLWLKVKPVIKRIIVNVKKLLGK